MTTIHTATKKIEASETDDAHVEPVLSGLQTHSLIWINPFDDKAYTTTVTVSFNED